MIWNTKKCQGKFRNSKDACTSALKSLSVLEMYVFSLVLCMSAIFFQETLESTRVLTTDYDSKVKDLESDIVSVIFLKHRGCKNITPFFLSGRVCFAK